MVDFGAMLSAFSLGATVGIAGVVFAAGFAVVCKVIKWAPINVTVHIKVVNDND